MSVRRYKPDPELIQFCTPSEKEILDLAIKKGSFEGVRKELELTVDQFKCRMDRLKRRAARSGYVPEHGLSTPLPEGQHLRGATIQRNGKGEIVQTWAKSWKDSDGAAQAFLDAVERAGQSCKGVAGVAKGPAKTRDNLLALYGAGDPHFGMQAWHRVAGGNWDFNIAEETLVKSIEILAEQAPPAKEAIFLNAGDMFHADNNTARTPASGHVLDVDSRWSKVLDVVLRTHLRLAKTLLKKHDKLRIIALPGNHDPQSSLVLQVCLKLMFQNEPPSYHD